MNTAAFDFAATLAIAIIGVAIFFRLFLFIGRRVADLCFFIALAIVGYAAFEELWGIYFVMIAFCCVLLMV